MDAANRELIFILVLMGVITVFAFSAVFIFLKVLRKERRARQASQDKNKSGPHAG